MSIIVTILISISKFVMVMLVVICDDYT